MTSTPTAQAPEATLAQDLDRAKSESDTSVASATTRERVLQAALDLFIEKGYDRTSLREIADCVGLTKAALYYHFESKAEILKALHLRLPELSSKSVVLMEDEPMNLDRWGEVLNAMVGEILAQRKIFLMHRRNEPALESLHREEHGGDHDDIRSYLGRFLADTRLTLNDRVRMAASFGVVFSSPFLSDDSFPLATDTELKNLLSGVLRDVLRG
jgi:AcrR family transcriptional regulator